MRVWISPELEQIEIEDDCAHSMTVVADPERYSIDPAVMRDYRAAIEDDDADEAFDYEAVIVLAEMAGWVRVSNDASNGRIAISASSVTSARKAIRRLEEQGHYLGEIYLDIERFVDDVIRSDFYIVDPEALSRFVRYGKLPKGTVQDVPFDAVGLVRSVLAARSDATAPQLMS